MDMMGLSSRDGQNKKFVQTKILPANFGSLDDVRLFVVQAAQQCGMDADGIFAVELAVDEAFSNIIEHAYQGECEEQVECSCQMSEGELVITLKDCGQPFDPTLIPEPDLNANLEQRRIGGLGVHFMRKLMDEVRFTFTTGPGGKENCNTLTLVKRRKE